VQRQCLFLNLFFVWRLSRVLKIASCRQHLFLRKLACARTGEISVLFSCVSSLLSNRAAPGAFSGGEPVVHPDSAGRGWFAVMQRI